MWLLYLFTIHASFSIAIYITISNGCITACAVNSAPQTLLGFALNLNHHALCSANNPDFICLLETWLNFVTVFWTILVPRPPQALIAASDLKAAIKAWGGHLGTRLVLDREIFIRHGRNRHKHGGGVALYSIRYHILVCSQSRTCCIIAI